MKLTRRGLLRALPALPLAANQAKKAMAGTAVNSTAEAMTGWGPLGAPAYHGSVGPSRPMIGGTVSGWEWMLNYLRKGAIPEWRREEMRREVNYSGRMDADIAGLRSVSLGHRIRMQKEASLRFLEREEIRKLEIRRNRITWFRSQGRDDDYY